MILKNAGAYCMKHLECMFFLHGVDFPVISIVFILNDIVYP